MINSIKSSSLLASLLMVTVIIVNAMAVLLPINQMSTGAISDLYPNYFVPAGFTFSIWSLIYLLLISFCGYTIWYAFSKTETSLPQRVIRKLLFYFILTCVINCSWIFLWHYLQIHLSLAVMLAFLITLILIYQILLENRSKFSRAGYIFLHIPFSVYLGWISVATIANTTALLVHAGWDGGLLSPVTWASIMMTVAVLLGLLFLLKWKDKAYALVICWALYGIYFKQNDEPLLAKTASIGIIVLLLVIIYQYLKTIKKNPGL